VKITDVLRDRGALKALLDPTHPRFETGDEESRQQARAQWHRDRLVAQVLNSPLPELDRGRHLSDSYEPADKAPAGSEESAGG
jgi:hypothetical protein